LFWSEALLAVLGVADGIAVPFLPGVDGGLPLFAAELVDVSFEYIDPRHRVADNANALRRHPVQSASGVHNVDHACLFDARYARLNGVEVEARAVRRVRLEPFVECPAPQ